MTFATESSPPEAPDVLQPPAKAFVPCPVPLWSIPKSLPAAEMSAPLLGKSPGVCVLYTMPALNPKP